MVILGGLEIVVGGYLVHRHYKNKNEEKRRAEAGNQRQNTYPPASRPCPSQRQPSQKYAYHAPQPQPQPQFQPPSQSQLYPAQTFPQPRPYPSQSQPVVHYQPQIEPLRRADSFATISSMPIANGSPPADAIPPLPPRPQRLYTQPQPINHLYNNPSFSVSSPSIGHSTVFHQSQIDDQRFGSDTIHEDVEPYGRQWLHNGVSHPNNHGDADDDPPPPYRP